MRIVSTGMEWVGRDPGGLNQYFADFADAMTGLGHQVKGYVTVEGEPYPTPPYIQDVMAGRRSGGTIGRLKAFREKVLHELKWGKPDVFNPHFALYAFPIERRLVPDTVPIVTNFHGPWADESLVEQSKQTLMRKAAVHLKKTMESVAYRRSDAFIVLSDYFRDVLSREYGIDKRRIHVIPGAADIKRFSPASDRGAVRRKLGLDERMPVLFTARRLARRMGIDRLIDAMREIHRHFPSVKLFIAGDGLLREELTRQIQELGLEGTVRLLGKIPADDLVRWYQCADLVIMPTVQLEGFGLVTVEALSCGTPVLGTPQGGTKEILSPFSEQLLFEDTAPEAMARKLTAVLSGQTVIPSRTACREYVERRYTWKRVAASVEDVFDQAVRERKEALRYEKGRFF